MTRNLTSKIKHLLLIRWFPLKERKHNIENSKLPKVKESEVWWAAIGENVGIEINGKSEYFSRPVVVFKKLSHLGFMGVPLSTKKHSGSWYVNFRFQGKEVCAVLSQSKVLSTARLYNRIGQIAEDDMDKIRDGFRELYSDK